MSLPLKKQLKGGGFWVGHKVITALPRLKARIFKQLLVFDNRSEIERMSLAYHRTLLKRIVLLCGQQLSQGASPPLVLRTMHGEAQIS